jgi:hypothetical protein
MRVLLRNTKTGLYLQTPGHWTEEIDHALDLQSRREATNFAFQMGFEDVEIFFDSNGVTEAPPGKPSNR